MTNQTETSQAESPALTLDLASKLAVERTRVAYDRTMLAWVRTATALITFGFTIYKFFEIEIQKSQQEGRLISPRTFGFSMIIIGLVSLALATFGHWYDMRVLRRLNPDIRRSAATALAALIGTLGFLALVAVTLRQ